MVRRILLAVNGSHRIVWLIRELGAGTQGVPAQLWQLDEERRIMTYRSAVKCWETMPCNANATARWARSRVAFPFQPLHVRNPKYAMNGNGSWQQSPSEVRSDNRLRSEGRDDRTGAIERILNNVHRGRLGADSTACLIEHNAAHRSAPLAAYTEVRRNVPCDASI